ncbi:MAG TPA: hypothetical protein QGF02_03885 [Candidatus Babeliales bacterium]|nr:hypothetical protein [Candidatus Babeliales bacterium]
MKNTTLLLSILFALTSPTLSYGGKNEKGNPPPHRTPKKSSQVVRCYSPVTPGSEKVRKKAEECWKQEIALERQFLEQARKQALVNKKRYKKNPQKVTDAALQLRMLKLSAYTPPRLLNK